MDSVVSSPPSSPPACDTPPSTLEIHTHLTDKRERATSIIARASPARGPIFTFSSSTKVATTHGWRFEFSLTWCASGAGMCKSPTRFGELVGEPEGLADRMREHTPDFAFGLIELFRMPFDKILGTPAGILTLRALKAERESLLLDDSVWDEALECLLRYIFDREIDKPQFRRKLNQMTDPKLNKNVMSLADQLRQEGREEGIEKGSLLTKQQAVIEALEVRFERIP